MPLFINNMIAIICLLLPLFTLQHVVSANTHIIPASKLLTELTTSPDTNTFFTNCKTYANADICSSIIRDFRVILGRNSRDINDLGTCDLTKEEASSCPRPSVLKYQLFENLSEKLSNIPGIEQEIDSVLNAVKAVKQDILARRSSSESRLTKRMLSRPSFLSFRRQANGKSEHLVEDTLMPRSGKLQELANTIIYVRDLLDEEGSSASGSASVSDSGRRTSSSSSTSSDSTTSKMSVRSSALENLVFFEQPSGTIAMGYELNHAGDRKYVVPRNYFLRSPLNDDINDREWRRNVDEMYSYQPTRAVASYNSVFTRRGLAVCLMVGLLAELVTLELSPLISSASRGGNYGISIANVNNHLPFRSGYPLAGRTMSVLMWTMVASLVGEFHCCVQYVKSLGRTIDEFIGNEFAPRFDLEDD